ncbi:hypothetical protein HN873_050207 [Arachis hypogaea]
MSLEYLLKERNVEMHNAMLSSGIFPRRRADLKIFQQPTPLPGDLLSGGSLLASPSPSAIEAARFLSERMGSCSGVVEGTCQWNVRSRDDWVQRSGVGLQEQEALYDMGIEAEEYFGDYESKDDGRNEGFDSDEGVGPDDVLRMEFNSPDEAKSFYNNYSRLKGFSMRQGRKVTNSAGDIVRYTFVCNRQGYREKKWLEMANRKREHKIVTRCGCLAEMRIKRKDGSGKWYVSRFVDEHNHELASGKFVDYLRSHRRLSEVEIAQMTSLREVGISIPKIYESFAAQLGGFNLVTFTKQDMYNEVRRQREMQNGDVSAAIRYLEGVSRVDNRIFWRYKVGSENNLCDLFWSDGRSHFDYSIFGDVLAFDATYGRNKYNLPVVVFSGVNHHNQTCVFGCAMVSCETQESYIWVLQQFLECMEGKAPKAVITDGDTSMRNAIRHVFPETHHRLCAWHLLRNATSNICDSRFTQLFRHCMLADMEVDEFEAQWEAMLDECGVREVEWVKDLYRKKTAWATAYIRGRFFAGIRTTSRCESLHAKLGRFVESRYGVLEFVTNFQRCIDFLRDNEDELEFRSWYGTPVLQTEFVELEKDGWIKYTREMFWRFREALKRCVRIHICGCNENAEGEVYVVQKYRRPEKKWEVSRQHVGNKFSCTCLRMESFGLPCVHILAVLVRLDYTIIPNTLVLRRWSKTAKLHYGLNCTGNETQEQTTTYRSRLGAFAQLCTRLGRVACMSDEDFKYYSHKVLTDTICLEIKNGLRPAEDVGVTAEEQRVKDPISVRTKGTGRLSQASASTGKKRRKCSNCGRLGHRRTRCPNRAGQEGGQPCVGVNKRVRGIQVVQEDVPSNNPEAVSLGDL